MPEPTLDDLFRRLKGLARHDRGRQVFGAAQHGYQVYPLTPEELEEARTRHGAAALPASFAWWVSEGPGAGAGPFYGLQHPLDAEPGQGELAGALPLSDHGCGYSDWLRTDGAHAGEVWVDLRESGGPLTRWYPSLEAWLDAWLRRSYAEWGVAALEDRIPRDADPAFLDEVRDALTWVTSSPDDPMLAQYPVPLDKAHGALGTLHLAAGDPAAAEAAFEAAVAGSKEPDAWRALARCRVARARNDPAAALAAAEEGLKAEPRWWITEGQLKLQRALALEGLERWTDALAAREEVAAHFKNDLQKNLDVVWIRMLREEVPLAAERIRDLATRGVGCDRQAPLPERIAQVSGGLIEALRREGMAERADALQAALGEA